MPDLNLDKNSFLNSSLQGIKTASILALLVFSLFALKPSLAEASQDSKDPILSQVYVSEINYFGRRATSDDNCRADGKLEERSQCGFDKWIELYNPTEKTADFSGYTMYFDVYRGGSNNISRIQKASLDGLTVPAESRVVIYSGRSNLASIIPQKSPNIRTYRATWIHQISLRQGDKYTNIAFYIAENSDSSPVLNFSLPDQPNPTDTFKTLEFCSASSSPTPASNFYYQDIEENKYYANPGNGRDCSPLIINSIESQPNPTAQTQTQASLQHVLETKPETAVQRETKKEAKLQLIPQLEEAKATQKVADKAFQPEAESAKVLSPVNSLAKEEAIVAKSKNTIIEEVKIKESSKSFKEVVKTIYLYQENAELKKQDSLIQEVKPKQTSLTYLAFNQASSTQLNYSQVNINLSKIAQPEIYLSENQSLNLAQIELKNLAKKEKGVMLSFIEVQLSLISLSLLFSLNFKKQKSSLDSFNSLVNQKVYKLVFN